MISDGHPPREIHVVMDGVARVSLLARDGRERVVSYLSRGDIFGEQQALSDVGEQTSSTAVFADSACVIGYIDPSELIKRIQVEPELLRILLRITHRKKRHLIEELERAVFQSARSQIAALLAALPRESGAITLSQERLAHLSGRTRVTIAAQLHSLESAGAIRLERSRIVILDHVLLTGIAEEP